MSLSMMTRGGQMRIFVDILNDEARGEGGDVLAYKNRVLARFLLAFDNCGPGDDHYPEKLVSLSRCAEEKIEKFLQNRLCNEGV